MKLLAFASICVLVFASACAGRSGTAPCSPENIRSLYGEAEQLDQRVTADPKSAGADRALLDALWAHNVDCSAHPELSAEAHDQYAATVVLANADGAVVQFAAGNYPASRAYVDRFLFLMRVLEAAAGLSGAAASAKSHLAQIENIDQELQKKGISRKPVDEKRALTLQRPARAR